MFKNLHAKFDGRTELPIEVQDICDALVEMGYQDDIRVVSEEMDLKQLLGTYTQWREPNGVYGEPKWVSLIVYPSNLDQMRQRVVCAKELVHICDAEVNKTNEPQEIMELAQALSDKAPSTANMQITEMKIATDILAQGKAYMLLFPKAARIVAKKMIDDHEITLLQLEEILQIPSQTIEEMLDPEWEKMAELLSTF